MPDESVRKLAQSLIPYEGRSPTWDMVEPLARAVLELLPDKALLDYAEHEHGLKIERRWTPEGSRWYVHTTACPYPDGAGTLREALDQARKEPEP